MVLSQKTKTEVLEQQTQIKSVSPIDLERTSFEYDELDMSILNKFLKYDCYTVQQLTEELLREKIVKRITINAIRKRLEKKYVKDGFLIRIKTFGVIYQINDSRIEDIKALNRIFIVKSGLSGFL